MGSSCRMFHEEPPGAPMCFPSGVPPTVAQNDEGSRDPPPLKWSDLRYVFDIKEDRNGKEAIQA
jgi:hypothetical protein